MIKIFETFAGIGAQHKAATKLNGKYPNSFEIKGISEWDIYANISYAAIHHTDEFNELVSETKYTDEIIEDLKEYDWSRDGKTLLDSSRLVTLQNTTLVQLWCAVKVNNSIGSVTAISGQDILTKVGDVDLLTYSFPCQDLSPAGNIHGFNKGMAKELETRSGLLWEIERIVKELNVLDKKPKYLLLENVPNMLSEKHIKHYREWIASLSEMGYSTMTFKLDSSKYGVPQKRIRVYGLSILNYEGKSLNGEILDMENPNVDELPPLEDFLRTDYADPKYMDEAYMAMPNRTPSREMMFENNPKLIEDERKYTRTITTKQDRHPNAGVINMKKTILGNGNREKIGNEYIKANYRFLTPRETYLLMGFTDEDYENVVDAYIKKDKIYKQAGNSIVVNTIEKIFELIMKMEEK